MMRPAMAHQKSGWRIASSSALSGALLPVDSWLSVDSCDHERGGGRSMLDVAEAARDLENSILFAAITMCTHFWRMSEHAMSRLPTIAIAIPIVLLSAAAAIARGLVHTSAVREACSAPAGGLPAALPPLRAAGLREPLRGLLVYSAKPL
eukprot:5746374-Prymnesium_polylepis.1